MHHPAEPCAPCHYERDEAAASPSLHQFDRLRDAQNAEFAARVQVEKAVEWRNAWGREHVLRTWRFVVLGLLVPLVLIGLGVAVPIVMAAIVASGSLALGTLVIATACAFAQWASLNAEQRRYRRERRRGQRARRARRSAATRYDFRVRGSAADLRQRDARLAEASAKYERALLELWEAEQGMPLWAVYPTAGFPREV